MLMNENIVTAFRNKADADEAFDRCIADALMAGYSNGMFNVNEDLAYAGFKAINVRSIDKVSGNVWINCDAEVSGILSATVCKVYELHNGRFVFVRFEHKKD